MELYKVYEEIQNINVHCQRISASGRWAHIASTIAVVYELTKRIQEMLFTDWAQSYI